MTPRRALAEQQLQLRRARRAKVRRVVFAFGVGAAAVVATVAIAADRLFWPRTFPIKEVLLEGEFIHVQPQVLREVVVKAINGNFFSVDLLRLERAAESLPWVYHANVRRVWPDSIRVAVEEQRPVARWVDGEWLNIDGEIVRLEEVPDESSLPALHGPADSARLVLARYRDWSARLQPTGLHITEMKMSDRRAYTLTLATGPGAVPIQLEIGRRELDTRLDRFVGFYRHLASGDQTALARVDVRYPNGVAATRRNTVAAADASTVQGVR